MSAERTIVLPNEILFNAVEQTLAEGRRSKFGVKGFSMRPFFKNEHDWVILEKHDPSALKRGDVVLFRYNGAFVLHRIVRRRGNELWIRGDAHYAHFECVETDKVIGIAVEGSMSGGKYHWRADGFWWKLSTNLWLLSYPLRNFARIVRNCIRKK